MAAVDRQLESRARALVAPLHPADQADLLERLPTRKAEDLVRMLGDDLDAEIADLSAHVDQGDALFHQLCQFDAQARRADFFSPANHQVCPLCVFECDVRS